MWPRLDPAQVYDEIGYRYLFDFIILERVNERIGAYNLTNGERIWKTLTFQKHRANIRDLYRALNRLDDSSLIETAFGYFDPDVHGAPAPHEQPRRAGEALLVRRARNAPLHLHESTLEWLVRRVPVAVSNLEGSTSRF